MHPSSKKERPRHISNNMSMKLNTREFWESIVVVVSYIVHYNTLLQNATDIITKCNSFFITKCDKSLLKKYVRFFIIKFDNSLLKKHVRFFITKWDSFMTNCDSYYKMHRIYYKMRQLLKNTSFITKCVGTKVKVKVTSTFFSTPTPSFFLCVQNTDQFWLW